MQPTDDAGVQLGRLLARLGPQGLSRAAVVKRRGIYRLLAALIVVVALLCKT
jgi:hypothetical protein